MNQYDLVFVPVLDERTSWGQVFGEMFHPFLRDFDCAIRPVRSTGIPIQYLFRQFFVTGYRANEWEIMFGPADLCSTPYKKILRITRWINGIRPYVRAHEILVVPSRWDLQMFRQAEVRNKIFVIPWGYNASAHCHLWVEQCARKFGCTYGPKFDLIEATFKEAFPNRDDVQLEIRAFEGALPLLGDKRMKFVKGRMQPVFMANWFANLLVYVTVTEDGSGLSAIQAMASKTPVLGDYIGSKTAYFDLRTGFPVAPGARMDLHRNLIYEMRRIYLQPKIAVEKGERAYAALDRWETFHDKLAQIIESEGVLRSCWRRRRHYLLDASYPRTRRRRLIPDPGELYALTDEPKASRQHGALA